jgi:RNA-directed DNA polymerase
MKIINMQTEIQNKRISTVNNRNTMTEPSQWNEIDWRRSYSKVERLRCRIFAATKRQDYKTLRKLQYLMLVSKSNLYISVRKICVLNQGKKTPGLDKLTLLNPKERFQLISEMLKNKDEIFKHKPSPVLRHHIPKSNGKLRPLGIPTIKDRVIQAIVVNALEPEWEAKFEPSSYGFRPGRSCHDALSRLFMTLRVPGKGKETKRSWILEADIKGFFDNVNHERLINKLGRFPSAGTKLIEKWLKAGYMDQMKFHKTNKGTPQGGVISPLLANIVLTGLEDVLEIKYTKTHRLTTDSPCLVRYADDFVVLCHSKEKALIAKQKVEKWLTEQQLELEPTKTKVLQISEGFDFLGLHIVQRASRKKALLLMQPNKKSIQEVKNKLRQVWQGGIGGVKIADMIRQHNAILRGWCNYHRFYVSSKVFSSLDDWMYRYAWRYLARKYPRKSKGWKAQRHFGNYNPNNASNWDFGIKESEKPIYILKASDFKIRRHVMVPFNYSKDDLKLKHYWENRSNMSLSQKLNNFQEKLMNNQNGQCPVCNQSLRTDMISEEQLEIHHIWPRKEGGPMERWNMCLLHFECHKQIHSNRTFNLEFRKNNLKRLKTFIKNSKVSLTIKKQIDHFLDIK